MGTNQPQPNVFSRLTGLCEEYPRPFWVLMAGTFIDRFGTNLIMPFLAIYVAQRFHVQITQIGIVFTIFAISGAAGNMLAGALADRFGRRLTLVLGMVGAATARIGLGMASDMSMLYVAAGFAALFGSVGWPAQLAMTADLIGPEKRANGFGIQRVIINSTFALGPMIGGVLGPAIGYLPLFVLDALTSYLVAFVVFRDLPETRPENRAGQSAENFEKTMAGYGQILRDGPFMLFVLVAMLAVTAYLQMSTTLSLFLIKFQHLPESFFGALVMLNALMVVFTQFSVSRWASKRPPFLMMLVGAGLYLVGFGAYGLPVNIPIYVIAMILITGGEMLFIPTSQALIALFAPEDMRARYVAAERFTWIIAQAFGPFGAGVIMDRYDPRWVWAACAILCSVSVVGFYVLHLYVDKQLVSRQVAATQPVSAG